jgi:predicted MFS family arabinose efflux permease
MPAAPLYPLICLMVLTHLTFTGARITLSLYALELNASPFTVGLTMSLLALVPMFLSVHTGRLTDRTGPTGPSLVALLLVIAGTLTPAIGKNIASLLAASVLIGTGFMIVHIAVNNAVGHVTTPANRKQAFSKLALGFSLSSTIGPVIAGFSIDHWGHAVTFLVLTFFPCAALAAWVMVRKTSPDRALQAPPPEDARVLDLLKDPQLRAVFIVSGLLSMGWDLFTFMVPLHGERNGLSATQIGLIMGTFGVATLFIRAAMPALARRFSEWQSLTAAMLITASVYFLYPLTHTLPLLLILAFVLGLGLGSAQPMVMSLIHLTAPPGRSGEAVGVRTTVMNASHTTLPLLFGALGSVLGLVPVFWTLAAILGAGGAFAAKQKRTQP